MNSIPIVIWVLLGVTFAALAWEARVVAVLATQVQYMQGFFKSEQGTRERFELRIEASIESIKSAQRELDFTQRAMRTQIERLEAESTKRNDAVAHLLDHMRPGA